MACRGVGFGGLLVAVAAEVGRSFPTQHVVNIQEDLSTP